MRYVIRHILRGMFYLPEYGSHPGTVPLILFVVLGGITGMSKAGWVGGLCGMTMFLVCFGPFYLWGAYERSVGETKRRKKKEEG